MTTFSTSQIPSNVNTLEELLAWSASALAEINPNILVTVNQSNAEPVVQCQTFRFQFQQTNPERLVVIAYLPLAPNWRSQGKIWSNGIQEISTNALPVTYTTN